MKYRLLLLLLLSATLAACSVEAVAPTAAATPPLLPLPSQTAPALTSDQAPERAATPVIIASPTPTATPVTHVVQEGETLLSVAFDYGVSLEALQAANPAVQARFLSIGTVLVIPPPEGPASVSATQLAPPPPVAVELSGPACYTVPTGPLYCFVEARNPGGLPLENVSARITLAAADGLPFATGVAYSAVDLIPVAGAAPLVAIFPSAPGHAIAATAVEVLTADLAGEPAPEHRSVLLDLPAQTGQAAGQRLMVSGEVRNPSDRPLTAAWVTLTLYDAAGAIAGYRKQPLADGLAPGEVRAFSVSALALGGSPDHYLLHAEGRP